MGERHSPFLVGSFFGHQETFPKQFRRRRSIPRRSPFCLGWFVPDKLRSLGRRIAFCDCSCSMLQLSHTQAFRADCLCVTVLKGTHYIRRVFAASTAKAQSVWIAHQLRILGSLKIAPPTVNSSISVVASRCDHQNHRIATCSGNFELPVKGSTRVRCLSHAHLRV